MPPRGTTFVPGIALLLIALLMSSCSDSTAPPKATGLRFVTAPPATAESMVPLTVQPVLQTVDAQGNPVGGSTTITVSVFSGLGQIEAGGTATTDENGVATFSNLTLGVVTGRPEHSTLQFAAPGLQPVMSDVDLHCAVLPLSVSQTVSRSLTTGDCAIHGLGFVNEFLLPTTQPVTAVQFTLAGAFPGDLILEGPNDRGGNFWGYSGPTDAVDHKFSYKALLPPGETYVLIASDQPAIMGSYTLTTGPAPEDLTCDFATPVVAGSIASVQKLGPGDCVQNSFLEDLLMVGLPAQATLTASMTSSAFNPAIELLDVSTGGLEKSSTGQGSTSLTFTDTSGAAHYLMFTSSVPSASGAYNFSLSIAYPSGSVAPAGLTLGAAGLSARNLIRFPSAQRAH